MKTVSAFKCVCVIFFLTLSSCTTNATLQVAEGAEGSFIFETTASEAVGSVVRSFSGTDNSISLFDAIALQNSFSQAGIEVAAVSAANTNNISITGISKNLNSLVPAGEQPIKIQKTAAGQTLSVRFNEETMGSLLSLMGDDALLYIELLQAPIFTGEKMSANEYLAFIGALYGNDSIVKDLQNSSLHFNVEVEGIIQEAKIEPASLGYVEIDEKKAYFTVSLYKFLSNTTDVSFEISW